MKKRVLVGLLAASLMAAPAAFAYAEETVTESMTEAAGTDNAALSDDLYSFQLLINGDLYQFPMSYTDFVALGWTYDGDETEPVGAQSYLSTNVFYKGQLKIYADIINLGINAASVSDCAIGGITLDSYYVDDAPETTAELPGGIVYNKATLDDIKAVYGEPSDSYEGDLYTKLTYTYDYYQDIDLYVDKETGVLDQVQLRNFVVDEEANAAARAEVSDEPTAEVLAYTAPEALSEDLLDYTVDFAGNIYRLPAPVSVFLENGFTLKAEDSDEVISGGGSGWAYFRKDNQEYHTLVKNYSADAARVENCFVTSIDVSQYDNLPITTSLGLTLGTSVEELESVLDSTGLHYEKNESSESYTYYKIEDALSSLDGYEFCVDNEEAKVITIEVSYQPRSLK